MSAYVLLNLLNKLGKRDKMRGLTSILSLFPNSFNKFNNTGAAMLDSIYHMTLEFLKNIVFFCKKLQDFAFISQPYNGHHYVMLLNL